MLTGSVVHDSGGGAEESPASARLTDEMGVVARGYVTLRHTVSRLSRSSLFRDQLAECALAGLGAVNISRTLRSLEESCFNFA